MIEGTTSLPSIVPSIEVTDAEDAGRELEADKLDLMDTATAPDVVTMDAGPPTVPVPSKVDAPEDTGSATPLGLRSSPPPLNAQVPTSNRDAEDDGDSVRGSKSDSEAETVVLPGADGYSPSKIRNKREIKLEDKINENGLEDNMDVDAERAAHKELTDSKMADDRTLSEGATSLLGKRKRSKHGTARLDDNHTGNSSGLSSVPTSPVAQSRSNLSKRADSGSDASRSASPGKPRREKINSKRANFDSESERDKEYRRVHRRRSSVLDTSGSKQHKDTRTKLPAENIPRHRRTHSPSPTRHNTISVQRSVSSSATNGLSHKKKTIPAPLRTTKERHSTDYQSDDSSTGESAYPRRSKIRNVATPPTGDSSHSLHKMPPHRRRPDRYGRTPLTDACEDGDYDKAKHLLAEYPEDLDQPDAAGNTPLQCASLNGHEDIVRLLLKNGCNIHCKNDLGDSPLLDAVENGHLEVVKLLLDAGVDPRARNKSGEEPIMKVDEDDDDAEAIREALMAARSAYARARPSAASHTPQAETSDSRNRRTLSHGRSNRTGQHQLYTPLTVSSLRTAAAKGDLQTVGMIAAVLEEGLDDAESLIAAAKGGHDEVLQILLAVGNANPDPPPIQSASSWEYATPMLAAIGGENIKVIELLLANVEDGRFNPTKRFRGRTYYEIAKERAGPLWAEEERLLKKAYDNYKSPSRSAQFSNNQSVSRSHKKKPSDSGDRSNGTKIKRDGLDNAENHAARRDQRPPTGADLSSPVRRGPGRPKKEGPESFEQEAHGMASRKEKPSSKRQESDRAVSPAESEAAKPRRKLVSGRDLKGERERQNSTSSTTFPPTIVMTGADDGDKMDIPGTKKSMQRRESKAASDTAIDRARSIKRDKSSDRMSAIRDESPAKRPRPSSTPPSESHEGANKRRRLEAEPKGQRRVESVRGPSPEHRKLVARAESSEHKIISSKDHSLDAKRQYQKDSERRSTSTDGRKPTYESAKSLSLQGHKSRTGDDKSARSSPEVDRRGSSAEDLAAKMRAQREAREAREKAELEAKKEAKEAREKAEAEARIKREENDRIEKERAEEAKVRAEEARLAREASEQRRLEEQAKREKEEAELLERQKREEAEAHRKAEEERKKQQEELQRIQREETERRRAAHIAEQRAERLRILREQEAARLAKLPPLLRWFGRLPNPATPEVAVKFKLMQGVRYDTIKPEATGKEDGREQWLLNTQVALLLGEKDLELGRCKFSRCIIMCYY